MMKLKTVNFLISFLLISSFSLTAQRKALVEHFTNTLCSVCKSNNPTFYNLFNQNSSKAIHIAYHPSVPYSNCILYQFNKEGNGARQSYYDIHGTPYALINGKAGSSSLLKQADYSNAYEQDEILSIEIQEASNKICKILFSKKGAIPSGNYKYYVALTEDELHYNAPNGEKEHFDVFREFFTSDEGKEINLLANDFLVEELSINFSNYDINKAYSFVVFVQNISTKEIIAVEKRSVTSAVGNKFENHVENIEVYPNPTRGILNISWNKDIQFKPNNFYIFNDAGQIVDTFYKNIDSDKTTLSLKNLPSGNYFLYLTSSFSSKKGYSKFIIL